MSQWRRGLMEHIAFEHGFNPCKRLMFFSGWGWWKSRIVKPTWKTCFWLWVETHPLSVRRQSRSQNLISRYSSHQFPSFSLFCPVLRVQQFEKLRLHIDAWHAKNPRFTIQVACKPTLCHPLARTVPFPCLVYPQHLSIASVTTPAQPHVTSRVVQKVGHCF